MFKMKKIIVVLIFLLITVFGYSQITLFIVQTIGSVPEGKTLFMLRMNKTKVVESAGFICAKEMNGVSLLCRGMTAFVKMLLYWLPYS